MIVVKVKPEDFVQSSHVDLKVSWPDNAEFPISLKDLRIEICGVFDLGETGIAKIKNGIRKELRRRE